MKNNTKGRNKWKVDWKEYFNGIFGYEYEGDINENIDRIIKEAEAKGYVNHISLGPDVFIRFWKKEDKNRLSPAENGQNDFYNIYNIKGLSFIFYFKSTGTHLFLES